MPGSTLPEANVPSGSGPRNACEKEGDLPSCRRRSRSPCGELCNSCPTTYALLLRLKTQDFSLIEHFSRLTRSFSLLCYTNFRKSMLNIIATAYTVRTVPVRVQDPKAGCACCRRRMFLPGSQRRNACPGREKVLRITAARVARRNGQRCGILRTQFATSCTFFRIESIVLTVTSHSSHYHQNRAAIA